MTNTVDPDGGTASRAQVNLSALGGTTVVQDFGYTASTPNTIGGTVWTDTNADGTLTYAFVESVKATYPFYAIRLAGGVLFLGGMLIMAYNVYMTTRKGIEPQPAPAAASAA